MARAYLAPSLDRLFGEINSRWPNRDRRTDGWYNPTSGSYGHTRQERGLVHAIDVDSDGINGDWIVKSIYKGGNVLWYVIWNRRIYSRNTGFRSEAYYGVSPHTDHLHIEVMHTPTGENYRGKWGIGGAASGLGSAPSSSGQGIVGQALAQTFNAAMNEGGRDYRDYFHSAEYWSEKTGESGRYRAAQVRDLRR